MYIDKNHKNLIESVIKENRRYKGNEQLLDIFLEAVYKKSYLLLDAMKDQNRLKRHLEEICDTCLEDILLEKQKFDGIRIAKKPPVAKKQPPLEEKKAEILPQAEFKSYESNELNSVDDPINFFPQQNIVPSKLETFINYIKEIDEIYPSKKYYDIFCLRYLKKQDQTQIAQILEISQIEVSKRFVELVNLIKDRYKH